MKKKKDTIMMIVTLIIIFGVLFGLSWWAIDASTPPNKNKAESIFNENRELLGRIITYFENSEHTNIHIDDSMQSGRMSINGAVIKIENETIISALDYLFIKQGFDEIVKYDNTIYFQRWTRYSGSFSSGITYSTNEKTQPTIQYLTKLEPLSEKGWYYYEADYNEWRKHN